MKLEILFFIYLLVYYHVLTFITCVNLFSYHINTINFSHNYNIINFSHIHTMLRVVFKPSPPKPYDKFEPYNKFFM
jgi:hypothetical protein